MKSGRKSLYKLQHAETARKVCAVFGAKLDEVAKVLGVSAPAVDDWIRIHPEFKAAIRDGKDTFDSGHVENALLRSAMGCQCGLCLKGLPPEGHARPNPLACNSWLNNREPDRWKPPKAEHLIEGGLTLTLTLQKTYEPNGTKGKD